MAERPPSVPFEALPLNDARRRGRGPRLEPMLYDTVRKHIQALSAEATRVRPGPGSRPERMQHDLPRIARELNVPVTVRQVPGGVVCWRSTDADIHQGHEVASRLQTAAAPTGGSAMHRYPSVSSTVDLWPAPRETPEPPCPGRFVS
jgi:hypothetical protein